MSYKKHLQEESRTQKIELDTKYYILVAPKVSYAEARQLSEQAKDDKEQMSTGLIAKCITEWNLDDDNGELLPINAENVEQLSLGDFSKVQNAVLSCLGLQKKE